MSKCAWLAYTYVLVELPWQVICCETVIKRVQTASAGQHNKQPHICRTEQVTVTTQGPNWLCSLWWGVPHLIVPYEVCCMFLHLQLDKIKWEDLEKRCDLFIYYWRKKHFQCSKDIFSFPKSTNCPEKLTSNRDEKWKKILGSALMFPRKL